MALWTIHHWTDVGRALGELRRVAGRVVVLAPAPRMNELWMTADYFPDMAGPRTRPEIQPEAVAEALGGVTQITTLLVPRDCRDWFGEALWGRPELYLDPDVRANMSAFRLIDPSAVDAGVDRLRRDLETGAWDRRHGGLRSLPEIDTGHRIVHVGRRRRLKGFAAPAGLSSPGRTDFRVASTARPPGFDLLGCPRRRRGNVTDSGTPLQPANCRTLRTSAGVRNRIVRKEGTSVSVRYRTSRARARTSRSVAYVSSSSTPSGASQRTTSTSAAVSAAAALAVIR